MRRARRWILGTLLLVLICLWLVACGGYSSGPGYGGTPAPTATVGGY